MSFLLPLLLVLVLVVYYLATSFAVVVVDEDATYMRPTLEPGGMRLLDRRRSRLLDLAADDIIVYRAVDSEHRTTRRFGRIAAGPGATVSVREQDLLVNGSRVTRAPSGLETLSTGLIVPRNSVFIVLDGSGAPALPLRERLVPRRNIIGRMMVK